MYAGASAGAHLACPSVEMAIWYERGNYQDYGLKDTMSLGLIPFLIIVHYKDAKKKVIKQGIKNCKYPVRILKDGQGLLIKDGLVEFIGEGEEVIIN